MLMSFSFPKFKNYSLEPSIIFSIFLFFTP